MAYFERFFREIYPPELELKRENIGIVQGSFLDLFINIEDNSFHTSLYDKRNNFSFHIVRMPQRKSNIPKKMFHSTITAEILRICRATSSFNKFHESCNTLIDRMKKQGVQIYTTTVLCY